MAVDTTARHAWVAVLAADAVAAGGSVSQARTLERAVLEYARTPLAVGDTDVVGATERAAATTARYTVDCRRMHEALRLNGARLLAAYGDDVTLLPQLDDAALEVGTAAEAFRRRKEAEQAYAKSIMEEKSAPVTEGIMRCTRCRSYDLTLDVKQTRSADEPSDVFWLCNACHAGGRRRG